MSSDYTNSGSSEIGVEVTDDVEDDWQRRQYLNQIYEAWSDAYETLREVGISPNRQSLKIAVEAVCGLIRVCRPMIKGSAVWNESKIGVIRIGERRAGQITSRNRRLCGLEDILAHEDGYRTAVEVESAGDGTATTKELRTQNLPIDVVRVAFDQITEELYNRDVLLDKDGEAEAKDRGGV